MRSGSCGLRVLPGVKQANSVVTVLPSMTAPGRPQPADDRGVVERPPAGMDDAAVLGREVRRVDDVLDRHRHAVQRPERPAGALALVERARLGAGMLGIEVGEGLDARLVRRDPREAGLGHLERRDLAGGDVGRELDGRWAQS